MLDPPLHNLKHYIPLLLAIIPLALSQTVKNSPAWINYNRCGQVAFRDKVRGICDPEALFSGSDQHKLLNELHLLQFQMPCPCDRCPNDQQYDILVVVAETLEQSEEEEIAKTIFRDANLGSGECRNGLLVLNGFDQGRIFVYQGEDLQKLIPADEIKNLVLNEESIAQRQASSAKESEAKGMLVPRFLAGYVIATDKQLKEGKGQVVGSTSSNLATGGAVGDTGPLQLNNKNVPVLSRYLPSWAAYRICKVNDGDKGQLVFRDSTDRVCDPDFAINNAEKEDIADEIEQLMGLKCPCPGDNACRGADGSYRAVDPFVVVSHSVNHSAIVSSTDAIYQDAKLGNPACDNGLLVVGAFNRRQLYLRQGSANAKYVTTEDAHDEIIRLLNESPAEKPHDQLIKDFLNWYNFKIQSGVGSGTGVGNKAVTRQPTIGVSGVGRPVTVKPVSVAGNGLGDVDDRVTDNGSGRKGPVTGISSDDRNRLLSNQETSSGNSATAGRNPSWDAWLRCSRSVNGWKLDGRLCDPDNYLEDSDQRTLAAQMDSLQRNGSCLCSRNNGGCPGSQAYNPAVIVSERLNGSSIAYTSEQIYEQAGLGNKECDNGMIMLLGENTGDFYVYKGENTKYSVRKVQKQVAAQQRTAQKLVAKGNYSPTRAPEEFLAWYNPKTKSHAGGTASDAKSAGGGGISIRDLIIVIVFACLIALLLLLLCCCCLCGWCCFKSRKTSVYSSQHRIMPIVGLPIGGATGKYNIMASNGSAGTKTMQSGTSNYMLTSNTSTLASSSHFAGGGGNSQQISPVEPLSIKASPSVGAARSTASISPGGAMIGAAGTGGILQTAGGAQRFPLRIPPPEKEVQTCDVKIWDGGNPSFSTGGTSVAANIPEQRDDSYVIETYTVEKPVIVDATVHNEPSSPSPNAPQHLYAKAKKGSVTQNQRHQQQQQQQRQKHIETRYPQQHQVQQQFQRQTVNLQPEYEVAEKSKVGKSLSAAIEGGHLSIAKQSDAKKKAKSLSNSRENVIDEHINYGHRGERSVSERSMGDAVYDTPYEQASPGTYEEPRMVKRNY